MRAEAVIEEVDRRWGAPCAACGIDLIGHDVVLSLFLGSRSAPRCAACLALAYGREREAFLRGAAQNVRRLACYAAGWSHADARLAALGAWPEERMPSALRMASLAPDERERDGEAASGDFDAGAAFPRVSGDFDAGAAFPRVSDVFDAGAAFPLVSGVFDAGDMGCGDLVLELRGRLSEIAPGAVLAVRAVDPGAPGDLPAWCRVTGHTLVHHDPPLYWIRRRAT